MLSKLLEKATSVRGRATGTGLEPVAQFTKEAVEYARKQHTAKSILLIDGITLAELMIEYNVGVSVEAMYSIKRIDSDFFDNSLN